MEQNRTVAPIGVFDSGLGGISVLKRLCTEMPREDYIFFGDRANAPYGNRAEEEVLALSEAALERLCALGCKGMVVACNTATAAADELRRRHPDFPIVAIEPAVKPAVEATPGGRILLMATPLALETERIRALAARFSHLAEITLFPCPGLVERIEAGHIHDSVMRDYLKELFAPLTVKPDALVLGCTHYPLISAALREYFGSVALFDGGAGTARQLKRILGAQGLLTTKDTPGSVQFLFSQSDPETEALARLLLNQDLL